jgi:hypothetical protein
MTGKFLFFIFGKKNRTIAISSRVHPGETNASWMMKGVLDFLLGNSAGICISVLRLYRDIYTYI